LHDDINGSADLDAASFPTETVFTGVWEPKFRDEINVYLKRDSDITDTRDLKLAKVVIDRILYEFFNYNLMCKTADKSMLPPPPSLFDDEHVGLRQMLNNCEQDKSDDNEVAFNFNVRTGGEV